MSKVVNMSRLGASPAKLALIAVLGLVLVGVLTLGQPDNADGPRRAARSPRQRVKPPRSETTVKQPDKPRDATPAWPRVSMEELLANNPFRNPRAEQTRASAPVVTPGALAELQQQGASIVVISNDEKTAMIGDRQYRIGDQVDGYRVTDITTDGVVLSEAPR